MQTPTDKTAKMLFSTEEEIFNTMVKQDHPFRKLKEIINFDELVEPLRACYSNLGTTGIDVEKGFKTLLVQFWEDYSDREMENAVRENIAIRWFCGFSLTEDTPDHTYFCKLRSRIGTKRIADIFNSVNESLKQKGLFGNVFTFIDASAIVSKTALWKERDKAIQEGAETLNNTNVSDYAADKDAKWGAKSKTKYWFGYKRSSAVDMRYGLIEKTAVTPAHILDPDVIGSICPKQGMVFTDKLYDRRDVDLILESRGCQAATIRKNNSKNKNRDLDRWRSGIRMPFEGTFSKLRRRSKFRGLTKVVMQNFMESICHNLKKAVTILPTQAAP
jgi:IS5 family transposase